MGAGNTSPVWVLSACLLLVTLPRVTAQCHDVTEALEPKGFKLAARLIAASNLLGVDGVPSNVTFFLPTDEAVEALVTDHRVPLPDPAIEEAVLHHLILDIGGRLSSALLYNALPGRRIAAELTKQGTVQTALGAGHKLQIAAGPKPGSLLLTSPGTGESTVVSAAPLWECGSLIYPADKVLLPTSKFADLPVVNPYEAEDCLASPAGCGKLGRHETHLTMDDIAALYHYDREHHASHHDSADADADAADAHHGSAAAAAEAHQGSAAAAEAYIDSASDAEKDEHVVEVGQDAAPTQAAASSSSTSLQLLAVGVLAAGLLFYFKGSNRQAQGLMQSRKGPQMRGYTSALHS